MNIRHVPKFELMIIIMVREQVEDAYGEASRRPGISGRNRGATSDVIIIIDQETGRDPVHMPDEAGDVVQYSSPTTSEDWMRTIVTSDPSVARS